MNKQERAIAYLTKQREEVKVMMNNMNSYMKSTDKDYNKLRQRHLDEIELLDYMIARLS